jgi:WD40 repeat protein
MFIKLIIQMQNRVSILSFLFLFISGTTSIQSQSIETVVQAGHYAYVTSVCYSSDGKFIATGSSDKTIILWRSTDGRQIRSFRGIPDAVIHLEFNRQITNLLSLSEDGTCMVWELSTGKLIDKMKLGKDIFTCASFSPDGSQIVTGSRKSGVSVWNSLIGEEILKLTAIPADLDAWGRYEYPETASVAFSQDGKYIIAGAGDYTAILFDAKTGKEIRKFKKINSSCTSCIIEAAITPDNKNIIIAQSDTIKMFDLSSGKFIKGFYGQGGDPENLSVSTDGTYFSAIEYGVAEIWDINSGKLILKAGDYSKEKVLAASFSPDGKHLITGNEKRVTDIWEISSGKKH